MPLDCFVHWFKLIERDASKLASFNHALSGILGSVGGNRSIGLKYRAFADANPCPRELAKRTIGPVKEVMREVLRGRIESRERLKIVDHLVVEVANDRPEQLL